MLDSCLGCLGRCRTFEDGTSETFPQWTRACNAELAACLSLSPSRIPVRSVRLIVSRTCNRVSTVSRSMFWDVLGSDGAVTWFRLWSGLWILDSRHCNLSRSSFRQGFSETNPTKLLTAAWPHRPPHKPDAVDAADATAHMRSLAAAQLLISQSSTRHVRSVRWDGEWRDAGCGDGYGRGRILRSGIRPARSRGAEWKRRGRSKEEENRAEESRNNQDRRTMHKSNQRADVMPPIHRGLGWQVSSHGSRPVAFCSSVAVPLCVL